MGPSMKRVRGRMEHLGDNFQPDHQAWPRAAGIGAGVDDKDAVVLHRWQRRPTLLLDQYRHVLQGTLDAKAARHENNDLGLRRFHF